MLNGCDSFCMLTLSSKKYFKGLAYLGSVSQNGEAGGKVSVTAVMALGFLPGKKMAAEGMPLAPQPLGGPAPSTAPRASALRRRPAPRPLLCRAHR